MTMLRIVNHGPAVEMSELLDFEVALGATLPQTFRRFLLECNGGLPEPNVVDVKNLPGSPTDIQVFFGVRRAIETSTLAWNLAVIRERFPNFRLLPIACDSGGNYFCLSLEVGNYGVVLFLDVFGGSESIFFVAANLDEFFLKIHDWQD